MTLAFTVNSKNTTQDLLLSSLLIPAKILSKRQERQCKASYCCFVCVCVDLKMQDDNGDEKK